jgi:aspartate kinase
MEQVIRARIPIRIKNVMNPRGSGTIIYPDSTTEQDHAIPGYEPKLFRTRSSSVLLPQQRPKRPTAVTIKHRILVINVHSNKRSLSHNFFSRIFDVLDKWRLSVDLIATSEVHVSMAIHSESALLAMDVDSDQLKILDHDLHGAIADLREYGTVDIIPHMAILSLVGKQMKNMVGIAGKMFSTLGENNVNIEMISQGEPPKGQCVLEIQICGRVTDRTKKGQAKSTSLVLARSEMLTELLISSTPTSFSFWSRSLYLHLRQHSRVF